jgi:glutathione S-transferase
MTQDIGTLVFYGNRESGHSYKVRLMLVVAGIPHTYTAVDLNIPRAERPEPFRSLAKFGEVPVLVADGQALVQSDAILSFLANSIGSYGAESKARWQRTQEWLFWEANRLGLSLPNLRFASKFSPQSYNDGALQWLRARYDIDIARLDDELSDGRRFILDNQPTVADFALCGYLFFADQVALPVPRHVARWLDDVRALPGWKMPYELLI